MCRQGLQFSRVSQTTRNLKFNPARFQAEQSLEQKLTLRKEVMFRITGVEHMSFKRSIPTVCLSRTNLIKRLHTDLLQNNSVSSHGACGKCCLSTGKFCPGCHTQLRTCLAVLGVVSMSQEFKAQTGDTTSTECFAWSSSV